MAMRAALLFFVELAVIGIVLGVVFGTTGLITNSLNGSLTIPTSIQNANNSLSDLSGSGLMVAGAVAIIMIVMSILYFFGGTRRI